MHTFLSLTLIAVIPVIFSILIWKLFRTSRFQQFSYYTKQLIIGIVFGIIAVCGTEFGVAIDGAVINVRDAAPLCAGLLFGAPAGILSGLIGGFERWFAVYWGNGYYTRLACTISTCLTGFLAAGLRKYMFDDKPAKWHHAFMIATIAEVIHMLMIFVTNLNDLKRAFTYVKICTVPMVSINAIAVGAAALAVQIISRDKTDAEERASIPDKFSKQLLVTVLTGFAAATSFSYMLQNQIYASDTADQLRLSMEDTVLDISQRCDDILLHVNQLAADYVTYHSNPNLQELASALDANEIDIVNSAGIVTASSQKGNIGASLEDLSCTEFRPLLSDAELDDPVLEFRPSYIDKGVSLRYSAVKTARGLILTAFDIIQVNNQTAGVLRNVISNRHIGESGNLLLLDKGFQTISYSEGAPVPAYDTLKSWIGNTANKPLVLHTCIIAGQPYYCMYSPVEDCILVGMISQEEADFAQSLSTYLTTLMQTVVFGALFAMIFIGIRFLIINNIRDVNKSLGQITEGNLDTVVNVRATSEFNKLSDDINSTVDTLKHYITEANQRIDNELRYAAEIQSSALPSIFPEREEFEIYALMHPAKEVGGDFYDFYFLRRNYLVFLVADVSGKGIPASLFMMRAKTTLKTLAENGVSVADIFTNANYALCEGNDAGLFVTAWMGFLNLATGELRYANAGHDAPLIRRSGGRYEYLPCPRSFVLGGMEGLTYKEEQIILKPGDEIFLYTDGVVEATNQDTELYGEKRLRKTINSHLGENAKTLCTSILDDVNTFYNGAPQFDDITELCIQFKKYKV